MAFPQQVTEQQTHDALAALDIEWRGLHVQSVTIGVREVTVVSVARDEDGRPYVADDGESLATHTHSISIQRPAAPRA